MSDVLIIKMLNISPVTSIFVECHVDLMYNSLAPEPVVIAAAHVHCVFFDIECGRDPGGLLNLLIYHCRR